MAAASFALGIFGLVVLAGLIACGRLERQYIHALAPGFSDEKLQGVALQKQAFSQPDLLVFYGSSELVQEIPNNATQFFHDYPTGFRVFAVGKPGTTSLAVLQKVAAVGRDLNLRKVAFSISPGWFFTEVFDPSFYEGNFSELQACEVAFSDVLSHGLKRDIARRMLFYPKTIEDRPLLEFALLRLAADTLLDRVLYATIWPLGRLQSAVSRTQDHFEAALHILEEEDKLNPTPNRGVRALNWNQLLKSAARFANAAAVRAKKSEVVRKRLPRASRDPVFLAAIEHAREWADLELLMRTFKELGAQPLLLSMPVEDIRLEVYGVSEATRSAYQQRLDEMVRRYGFPLRDFREHEKDPSFLVDFLDHLSAKGWLYYDKALDDFFHNRPSKL